MSRKSAAKSQMYRPFRGLKQTLRFRHAINRFKSNPDLAQVEKFLHEQGITPTHVQIKYSQDFPGLVVQAEHNPAPHSSDVRVGFIGVPHFKGIGRIPIAIILKQADHAHDAREEHRTQVHEEAHVRTLVANPSYLNYNFASRKGLYKYLMTEIISRLAEGPRRDLRRTGYSQFKREIDRHLYRDSRYREDRVRHAKVEEMEGEIIVRTMFLKDALRILPKSEIISILRHRTWTRFPRDIRARIALRKRFSTR